MIRVRFYKIGIINGKRNSNSDWYFSVTAQRDALMIDWHIIIGNRNPHLFCCSRLLHVHCQLSLVKGNSLLWDITD